MAGASVWVGSHGSSSGQTSAASLERWPLEPGEHGAAIALAPRARLVAIVATSRPDSVLLSPLPREVASSGDVVAWRHQTLTAPSGPLRALKLCDSLGADDTSSAERVLLLAATSREAYLWDLYVSAAPAPPLHLLGIEVPPPALPALAFDATGSLAVVGGSDTEGTPRLAVFVTSSGATLLDAEVPTSRSEGACATAVTACSFLRDDFAFVLVVATHSAGSRFGHVLAYDLRGCGAHSRNGFPPAHETEALAGAPFLAIGLHRAQGSTFLVGGERIVRVLQVRERAGSLVCEQLADVPLGVEDIPVWLRNNDGEEEADARTCAESALDDTEDNGCVIAIEAIGCRVSGPASLGLCGIAAIVVTTGAVHAVWAHRRCTERLGSTRAVGAAVVCVAPQSGTMLAGYLHAFADGGQLMRLSLSSELRLPHGYVPPPISASPSCTSPKSLQLDEEAPTDPPICSVMPIAPIAEETMLGRALVPSRPSTPARAAAKRSSSAPLRGQSTGNQPVTFHRKVKSAGYGPSKEPPRVLGRPRLTASRPAPKPDFGPRPAQKSNLARPSSANAQKDCCGGVLGGYAAGSVGPPLDHCPDQAVSAYSCAVTDLCYAPQATHLIVAGSDRTISAFRLPLQRSRAADGAPRALGLSGHEGDVGSMCPSYGDSQSTGGGGGPLLLTTASDRTARLWALGGPHAGADLIRFDRLQSNTRPVQREENPLLEQVQDAQFMCLDGAIALATGARLGIYKYQLHVQNASDDIKRLQRLGSYRCCGLLSLPREPSAGQSIVAVAANNAVMSGTVLVASSSKRIYAWDVAAEKVLACVPECSSHARPITCLRLSQPHSEFQSLESMDLFYSAATDGTVRLWDLRSMQECQRFSGGHVHTAQRLRCRVSPCLRYLCAPSEDGGVCAYDVRTGSVLGSRHCHRDVVCAVDMHPRSGCMASGGFDGLVQLYRPPLAEGPPKPRGRPPGGMVERRERASSEARRMPRTREVEMGMPC